MVDAIRQIPFGWFLLALLVALLAALVGLLVGGVRLRRSNASLERELTAGRPVSISPTRDRTQLLGAVAVVLAGAFFALSLVSVRHARGVIRAAMVAREPADVAQLLGDGFSGQLNAVAFSVSSLLLVSSLGAIAFAFAVSGWRRRAGLFHAAALATRGEAQEACVWASAPGPTVAAIWASTMLLVGMGLWPVARAGALFVTTLIQTFAGLAGRVLEEKIPILELALQVTRRHMDAGREAGLIGLAIALPIVLLINVVASPERRRRRSRAAGAPESPPGVRRGRATSLLMAAELLGAAALFVAARPLQAENAVPWPPLDSVGEVVIAPLQTPALTGPDKVVRAPVIATTPQSTELDGVAVDDEELGGRLRVLRTNYRLLHPGEPFAGDLIVACDPATSSQRLRDALHAAALAGYKRPRFVFIRRERAPRPMFGPIEHVSNTAARASIVDSVAAAEEILPDDSPAPTGAVTVRPAELRTCGDLAARVVAHRRQGHEVLVNLDEGSGLR